MLRLISLATLSILVNLSGFSQHKEVLHLNGSIWDYETGVDLPAKITTYWKGSAVSVVNNKNKIEASLSKSTDALLFESPGYPSLKLPVFFWGPFRQASSSALSLKTNNVGKPIETYNYIIFGKPADLNSSNRYELKHYNGDELHCSQNITEHISADNGLTVEFKEDFKNQEYRLSVKSESGKVLMENDFMPQNGINFIDLNVYPDVASSPGKTEVVPGNNKLTESKVYYFEQSKYDLLNDNKARLDSLVTELSKVSGYTVKIKGFTDQVGDAKLNAILAEYRSKVVANYLITKGIGKEKIAIDWESKDAGGEKDDSEKGLEKYRKVEIQIKL